MADYQLKEEIPFTQELVKLYNFLRHLSKCQQLLLQIKKNYNK